MSRHEIASALPGHFIGDESTYVLDFARIGRVFIRTHFEVPQLIAEALHGGPL